MPVLSELITTAGSPPSIKSAYPNNAIIEPLDGPVNIDQVMERFPEEVYHHGRDTHLYRLLQALCGDAGAGLIRKQAYTTRLRWEAEFLSFKELDTFYAGNFSFPRLASETYSYNTDDALTPAQWDEIALADQSYRSRIQDFFRATRFGTSPPGLRYAARAGSGIECEVVEHYRYIFDQYTDDPLGLTPLGTTLSTSEIVVIPRLLNSGVGNSSTFTNLFSNTATFTPPTIANARPAAAPTGPDKMAVAYGYGGASVELLPEIERNLVSTLDRIKPATTFATIKLDEARYSTLVVDAEPFATSEMIQVSRFVEGHQQVDWPTTSTKDNSFIVAGEENESGFFLGSARELPVIFLSAESIHSYTNDALLDSAYGTSDFYAPSSGPSGLDKYKSEHAGQYFKFLTLIYPFLQSLSNATIYSADRAIAQQDTPLVIEGSSNV